jgi:hypothetical protein
MSYSVEPPPPHPDGYRVLFAGDPAAYHRFAIPNGDGTHREVCLDRLELNADGSIVPVKPTL